jgi:predicted PurR-regulated permease PerM
MISEHSVKKSLAIAGIVLLGTFSAFALVSVMIPVFSALILFVLFRPVQQYYLSLKFSDTKAALFTILTSIFTLVVPLFLLSVIIIGSTTDLFKKNQNVITYQIDQLSKQIYNIQNNEQSPILDTKIFDTISLREASKSIKIDLGQVTQPFFTAINNAISSLTGLISGFMFNTILAYIILFFLLQDMHDFHKALTRYSPFSHKNTEKVIKEISSLTRATLIGAALSAIAQAVAMTLCFVLMNAFFGTKIEALLFWALLTGITSIIPVVGSMLIWLPAAVIMLLFGNVPAAIFVLIYGAVVNFNVDNLIKSTINAKLGGIHPVLSILGIVSGVPVFGILGIVLGPLLFYTFLRFVTLFQEEYISKS